MSELQNSITKDNIRTQLNLIFALMRLLATVLNLAKDNQLACETLDRTAESVFEQAAVLFRDIKEYTAAVAETK